MDILSFKPGHDGQVAAVRNSSLLFSVEAEKDSFPRYEYVTPTTLMNAAERLECIPDVVAVSGWVKGWHSVERPCEAGYFGAGAELIRSEERNFMGKRVRYFSSSHERSHLMCAYGLSPFPQFEPCYVLVWEGNIGDFYYCDERVNFSPLGHVLTDPGNKYSYLFTIADPSFPNLKGHFRFGDAGKLMALAAFSDRSPMSESEQALSDYLLAKDGILLSTAKAELKWSHLYDCGVESEAFKNMAGKFSNAIFDRFYQFARQHIRPGLPLLIAGGCGLNCEWNSKWRDCGLFSDVFVPPCTNDSGSAVGTAIDAQWYYTGNAKIEWDVYAGQEFECDFASHGFDLSPLDIDQIAGELADGAVVGWVQGRCEMGPRALGNRSLLAAPFHSSMRDRLNHIKGRENYRPVAPVCLEEDLDVHFECGRPDPYMLFFNNVRNGALGAVTHVDGSARVQSVNEKQNPRLYSLLRAFKRLTGYGVLCNTSLNFKGRGFINRLSDLCEFTHGSGINFFVVQDRVYRRDG